MSWYKQWWAISLAITVIAIAFIVGLLLIPNNLVRGLVVAASLIYVIVLLLNPVLRYWRLLVFVVSTWLTARFVPNILVVAESSDSKLVVHLANELGPTHDIAVAVLVVVLFILDFRSRHPSPIAKWLGARLQFGIGSTQQMGGPNSQQVQIRDLSGNSVSVSIDQSHGIDSDTVRDLLAHLEDKLDSQEGINHDFNAEIDVARDYTKNGQPDIAIAFLEQIRERYWSRLSDPERFRVLANLGHGRAAKDDHRAALKYFVDAKSYQPDDEKARSLEAAAYFSAGNSEKAYRLANKVLDDCPTSEIANAVKIRSAPAQISLDELEESLPDSLSGSAEVLMALSMRAVAENKLDRAESIARDALEGAPDATEIKEHIAALVVQQEAPRRLLASATQGGGDGSPRLREAIALLNEVYETRKSCGPFRVSRIRFTRGAAYELLGETVSAEADYRAANDLDPSDSDIARRFAILLDEQDRIDQAISVLRPTIKNGHPSDNLVILASFLAGRGADGDQAEAKVLLSHAIPQLDQANIFLRSQIVSTLAHLFGDEGQHEEAIGLLDSLPNNTINDAFLFATRADVAKRCGDIEQAREMALRASDAIRPNSEEFERIAVAQSLSWLNLDAEALVLWRTIVPPTRMTPHVGTALESARKCGDDSFIVEFCSELRNNGIIDEHCIELEIATLTDENELSDAVEAIDAYLALDKNDFLSKTFRVRRSLIGMQLGHPNLLESNTDKLPSVDEATPHLGAAVTQILSAGPEPLDAVRYAYELVRRNFSSHEAHMALIYALGIGEDEQVTELSEPKIVELGAAVKYREDTTGTEKWLVIEDSPDADIARQEISISHPLAKELLGKGVGDEFCLRKDELQPLTASIIAITSKYTFRKFDSMDEWENRFHDVFFVRKYNTGKTSTGEPDVGLILQFLERHKKRSEQVNEVYRSQFLSIGSYARMAQLSIFNALLTLASDTSLPIRCCRGTDEEYAGITRILECKPTLVLDPTALATLFFAGAHGQIETINFECSVPQRVLSEFRADLLGKYSRLDSSQRENVESFLQWLSQFAVAKGNLAVPDLEEKVQGQLSECFGATIAECVALAAANGAALWTDDFTLAESFCRDLQVPRVWTQSVLEYSVGSTDESSEPLTDLAIKLVDFGYTYVRLTPHMVCQAARQSKWNPEQRPLSQAISWLSVSGVNPDGLLGILAGFLTFVWRNASFIEQRESITKAVTTSVLKRSDGAKLLELYLKHIEQVFTVDPLNAVQCARVIRSTIDTSKPAGLILPFE